MYNPLTKGPLNTVQCSTVQYSTVTGEEDGVRGWITPYSTLCGVSVTGAASLVAECGTKFFSLKKMPKITFLNPFLGNFQKSVTGSENMCRFVMASSSQKWY